MAHLLPYKKKFWWKENSAVCQIKFQQSSKVFSFLKYFFIYPNMFFVIHKIAMNCLVGKIVTAESAKSCKTRKNSKVTTSMISTRFFYVNLNGETLLLKLQLVKSGKYTDIVTKNVFSAVLSTRLFTLFARLNSHQN